MYLKSLSWAVKPLIDHHAYTTQSDKTETGNLWILKKWWHNKTKHRKRRKEEKNSSVIFVILFQNHSSIIFVTKCFSDASSIKGEHGVIIGFTRFGDCCQDSSQTLNIIWTKMGQENYFFCLLYYRKNIISMESRLAEKSWWFFVCYRYTATCFFFFFVHSFLLFSLNLSLPLVHCTCSVNIFNSIIFLTLFFWKNFKIYIYFFRSTAKISVQK